MSDSALQGTGAVAWIILGAALMVALGFVVYFLWTLLLSNKKRRHEKTVVPNQTAQHPEVRRNVAPNEAGAEGKDLRAQQMHQANAVDSDFSGGEHDPRRLLFELLGDLNKLVEKYSDLAKGVDASVTLGPLSPARIDAVPGPQRGGRAVNDMALIDWWETHGGDPIEMCKASLAAEFGDVVVELVSGRSGNDEWEILAIGKNGDEYYLLPRKTGWIDDVFDGWFRLLEHGSVRGSELIRSIRSPLARAVKMGDAWELVGRKGVVSVNPQ